MAKFNGEKYSKEFQARYKSALEMVHAVRPMTLEPFRALLNDAEWRALMVGVDMGAIRFSEVGYVVPSLWKGGHTIR